MKLNLTIILVSILTLLCSEAFAQQIADIKSFRLQTTKYDQVLSQTDGLGNMAFVFYKKKKLEIKVVSSEYFITAGKSIVLSNHDKYAKMIGINMDEKFVNVYFISSKTNILSCSRYNKFLVTETPTYNTLATIPMDESILKGFSHMGKYRLITLQRNGTIKVYTIDQNLLQVDEYTHDFNLLYKSLLVENGNLEQEELSEIGIDKMDYFGDSDINSTQAKNKLYVVGKKVHLVLDDNVSTKIISLDLANKQASYKKYIFHLERTEQNEAGNSFLYKDKLFRISSCKEMLNVSVIHLDSNALLKTYNVYDDEPFTFKNGSILFETNYEKESDDLEIIESTSKFLRKIENTNISIAVNKVKFDNFLVFVGGTLTTTYSPNNGFSPGFGGFGLGSGLSIGTGIGLGTGMGMGMGYPYGNPFGGPMGNNYNSYTKTKNIYFKSMIDSKDLSHINGNTPKTLQEVLKGYSENNLNKFSQSLTTTTGTDSKIIYGYLSGKDDLYHLLEINR